MKKFELSGNTLKFIGALSMFLDHMGFILFPDIIFFRIIGRLAFPIFAFMISEGCRYTKNILRYFFTVLICGILFQLAYYIATGQTDMNIFITFSISIALIISLKYFSQTEQSPFAALGVIILLCGVFILNSLFEIDYGVLGSIAPVFSLLTQTRDDEHIKRVMMFSVGLLILCVAYGGIQYYSLLAIPLLLSYNGKRGKLKLKYFFYIFYPTHLMLLQGIYILIA